MLKRNIIFAVFLASFIEAIALSNFGVFEDSAIYYELFNNLSNNGFFEGATRFFLMTGKFEPMTSIIFYLQSLILPVTEFWFLFSNYLCINGLVSIGCIGFFSSKVNRGLAFFLLIALFSYGFYSRALYIWRTMYALGFLLIALSQTSSVKKVIFLLFALLSHYTVVVFLILYFCIKKFTINLNLFRFVLLSLSVAFICSMAIKYTPIVGFFVSGGETDVFFVSDFDHALQAILAIGFTLLSLICVSSCFIEAGQKSLLRMLIFLCIFSIINSESYHLMNRLSAPSLIITPFIVLLSGVETFRMKIIKLGTGLSVLASFRLIYLFWTGGFTLVVQ